MDTKKQLTIDEVADIFRATPRTINSYIEEGLIPSTKIDDSSHIFLEELAQKLGVKDFNEPFITSKEAQEFLESNKIFDAAFCKKEGIPFYRLSNSKETKLLFRKSELEIWKNRRDELSLEYDPIMLSDIHRDNLLKYAWHVVKKILFHLPERDAEIYDLFLCGATLEEVAIKSDFSKLRVKQIIEKSTRELSFFAMEFSKIIKLYLESGLSIDEISEFIKNYSYKVSEINKKEKTLLILKEEFVNFLEKEMSDDFVSEKTNPILKKKLRDFDLSVRALNCLKAAEVETLEELCSFEKNDLLKFRNFGKKAMSEIVKFVEEENGFSFGMTSNQANKKAQEIIAKNSIPDLIKKAGYVKIEDEETLHLHGYVRIK